MSRKVYEITESEEMTEYLLKNDNGNYGNIYCEILGETEDTSKRRVEKLIDETAADLKKLMCSELSIEYIKNNLKVIHNKDKRVCNKCGSYYWADNGGCGDCNG